MIQGHRRSIKKETPRNSNLTQTNIFDAFNNLTALSKKQQMMKLQKKIQSSSPLVIVISDESDSEESGLAEEVTTKVQYLKFQFEDESDDSNGEDGYPQLPESSSKRNVCEMMVLNRPIACSTPLRPSPTSPIKKETVDNDSDCTVIMESNLEEFFIGNDISTTLEETSGTFSDTNPNIHVLNSAGASSCIENDSDSTIIMENTSKKIISIKENILLSPKTTQNKAGTSTCREDIERVGSRNHIDVDITPSCRSADPVKIETDKNNVTQKFIAEWNNALSGEHFLSHMSPLKKFDTRNQSKMKPSSSEASNTPSGTPTEPSMIHKKSNSRNQSTLKPGSSGAHSTPSGASTEPSMNHKKSDSRNRSILQSDISGASSPISGTSTEPSIIHKKSDTRNKSTLKPYSSEANGTASGASTESFMIHKKKSNTRNQSMSKPGSSEASGTSLDASTEPFMIHKKKSNTRNQSMSKPGSSETSGTTSGVSAELSMIYKKSDAQNQTTLKHGSSEANGTILGSSTEPSMIHKKSDTRNRSILEPCSSEANGTTSGASAQKSDTKNQTTLKPCSSEANGTTSGASAEKSDTKNQTTLKPGISEANGTSLGASTEPFTNHKKDTRNQSTSKPGSSEVNVTSSGATPENADKRNPSTSKPGSSRANNTMSQKNQNSQNLHQTASKAISTELVASSSKNDGNQNSLKSCSSDNTKKETKNNSSQIVSSNNNNNNILSSSNVFQTPTKSNLKEPSDTTPGKEKCSSSVSDHNGIKSLAIHPKEVNSTTSSIIPPTPTKRKLSDSPTTSPSKRANKTPSPKKEERGMNLNCLKVFKELVFSVSELPHLRNLIEDETILLKWIISLKDPKYFYVILKLFTWLPKRYNIFRFCEKIMVNMEDKEVVKMYTFLQENGIVEVDFSKEDISSLLGDLDHSAIKKICEKFKLNKNLNGKKEMINALLKFCKTQSTLTFKKSTKELILDEVLLKMGKCVKLKNNIQDDIYKAFLLGTFTNPAFTNIQDFFKCIFTKTVFPEYRIESYCVFYTREEFTRYATARRFKDGFHEAFKNRNHIEVFLISETVYTALGKIENEDTHDRFENVPHLKRFTAHSVYSSILSEACEYLKTKYPIDVKKWLKYLIRTFPFSHRLGNWYYQLTWLYMKYLKPINYVQSAKLLIEILKKRECLSEVQLQMLVERGEQLKRGTKFNKIDQLYHDTIAELVPEPINLEHFPQTTVDAKAIRSNDIGKKRKYLVHAPGGEKNYLSVENIALEYYTNRCGYTGGIHCEGSLIKASFTLFFWDLIYNPEQLVPGTFLSKYQDVPLDMMTTFFYTNRKEAIDKRLREISSEWSDSKTVEFVKNSFDMHSHESGLCEPGACIKDAEILEILVNCIGRKVLAKIYERLVKNIGQYLSGMPDLFLWNIKEKKSKFVEVKGENDKLSVKQNLWLKYLESIGAHIEVCIVHSIGSKRKQNLKCVTASTECTEGEGREKEQASSSSTSSCSKTPINKKRTPKLKNGTTVKKPRIDKETKEDSRASTSAKAMREDNGSESN